MPFHLGTRVKNMTRETKVGLVVSCSFLSLLGVVLALKLTEPPAEAQDEELAAAAPSTHPEPPLTAAPLKEKESKRPVAPITTEKENRGTKNPAPTELPSLDGSALQLTAVKSSTGSDDRTSTQHEASGNRGENHGSDTNSGLPPIPAPPSTATTSSGGSTQASRGPGSATTPGTGNSRPTTDETPSLWPQVWAQLGVTRATGAAAAPPLRRNEAEKGSRVAMGNNDGSASPGNGSTTKSTDQTAGEGNTGSKTGQSSLPLLGSSPPGKKETNPPPLPPVPDLTPGGGGSNGDSKAVPPLPPVPGGGTLAPGGGSSPGLPELPATGPKATNVPPLPPPPPLAPPGGTGSTGTTAVTPPGGKPQEMTGTIDIEPAEKGPTTKSIPKGSESLPLEVKPPVPAKPAASSSVTALPKASTLEPIPIGSTPSASVPPLSIAAPAGAPAVRMTQPDVISYTEEPYGAKVGDTFKSISQVKYGTDKYAIALYHFNNSHPLVEGALFEDKPLTPAQKIYIPPVEILQSRYPEQIPGSPPAVPVLSVAPTSQRSNAPPSPRKYQVQPGGEFAYDIARRLLGDGERLTEIKDLNPNLSLEKPIPAGTQLTLPPDVRVPQ
jgi:hypothetical protein